MVNPHLHLARFGRHPFDVRPVSCEETKDDSGGMGFGSPTPTMVARASKNTLNVKKPRYPGLYYYSLQQLPVFVPTR
jgi:hypothetical protein